MPFVWGQYASAATARRPGGAAYFASGMQDATTSAGSDRRSPGVEAGWPTPGRPAPDEDAYSRMRTSEVETLLIGGALDTSTPPQVATQGAAPVPAERPPGRAAGFGHIGPVSSRSSRRPARTLINTFFASGRVDDSLYEPQQVDFTPDMTLPTIAKGIGGHDGRPARC